MAISVRIRFEVFKRDGFTCQYCGKKSPEVVLEADHIVPASAGGSDDPINLITACWGCNSGKSNVPLKEQITAEDPHDRAIMILQRERELKEYNEVLAASRKRREEDAWELVHYWLNDEKAETFNRREFSWLLGALEWVPKEMLRDYMDAAIRAGAIYDLRYVKGCVRTLRGEVER